MPEDVDNEEANKPEMAPVDYTADLEAWYAKPMWGEPPKPVPEEKTAFVGIRFPREILAAADAHAKACNVNRTVYIRNCVLTAMFFWREDAQRAMNFMSALWSNPAVKVFMQGLFKLAESLDVNALEELSKIATSFDCEIFSRKTGISSEKIREAVGDSLASLLIQEKVGTQVAPPLKVAISSTPWDEGTAQPSWQILFFDLFEEIESFPFELKREDRSLSRILEKYTGADLSRGAVIELLNVLTPRPRQVIAVVLEAVEGSSGPGEKPFTLRFFRSGSRAGLCIDIVCREAARWEAFYRYTGVDGDAADAS